ncbi:hypothetical protein E3O19_12245 [Cryobacterium algoritolerans]|uniref:Asp23/Gls24 family envelope stress response protein n=1 Tax=Cryobacterium algoritolerans TaxID=1259184 RepID=A0A4R8WQZ2_9MICO|nr:hypothetical protein [Cryobacterium algoritolerans]TFC13237.1 hypothetical protein E3O19_12245 [Cryobacterium algoritolerans]
MTSPDEPFVAFDLDTADRELTHLVGHTIEELSDYLDRNRTPADPTIDDSPQCQIALRSLQRLRGVQRSLLSSDVERESERSDGWVRSILQNINLEARSGRDIPIAHPSPTARLVVTEGAVRGLLRATGDGIENIIVGRCRLDGDVTAPGTPITIRVDAAVCQGENIPAKAQALRQSLYAALAQHTDLTIAAIDITVRDLYLRPATPPSETEQR